MEAAVVAVPKSVAGCTQRDVELVASQLWVVSPAASQLPLQIDDASRPEKQEVGRLGFNSSSLSVVISQDPEGLNIRVNQDTRLDNRVLDLRTPANQAIFRLEAGVCRLFRDILTDEGFTEIHTPKIIPAASEGGANVFTVSYFKGSFWCGNSICWRRYSC